MPLNKIYGPHIISFNILKPICYRSRHNVEVDQPDPYTSHVKKRKRKKMTCLEHCFSGNKASLPLKQRIGFCFM